MGKKESYPERLLVSQVYRMPIRVVRKIKMIFLYKKWLRDKNETKNQT